MVFMAFWSILVLCPSSSSEVVVLDYCYMCGKLSGFDLYLNKIKLVLFV